MVDKEFDDSVLYEGRGVIESEGNVPPKPETIWDTNVNWGSVVARYFLEGVGVTYWGSEFVDFIHYSWTPLIVIFNFLIGLVFVLRPFNEPRRCLRMVGSEGMIVE